MREIDVIYNKSGTPELRLLENGRLVDFDGNSIGFLDGEHIYDYNGVHRGWYIEGIFRDHNGDCVGFGEKIGNTPHPFLPFKEFKPFPAFVEFEPFRPFKELPPIKAIFSFSWSEHDPISIFNI
jgi:hypothetical protein